MRAHASSGISTAILRRTRDDAWATESLPVACLQQGRKRETAMPRGEEWREDDDARPERSPEDADGLPFLDSL